MRRLQVLGALALVHVAAPVYADDEESPEQVVVVNAAAKLGSVGQIARLRRVLDSRNMLVKLDKNLEATLDGRNVLIADVDAIREAYGSADYELALKIIDTDEQRILGEAVSRDPIPALAELSQWRGIIAAALNQQDEAERWFRAAYRFNPAWVIDKKLASPRVRSLVKRAKREPDETGTLRVNTDPNEAQISINGGEAHAAGEKLSLPVGKHLVMITAPKRKPYAELVEIAQGETYRIDINLDPESTLDRAARLVDASVAAPAGKPRLKRAKALAKLTGVPRLLFIEDGGEDQIMVRLYDVDTKKVSKPLELGNEASSAAIARQIIAALDPENLVDVDTIIISQRGEQRPTPWYKRWYV
ncbi:MAG TPA: PEGA domain-containing protein, partial [Kofleriaceae bacterium]|nr:PEGA domain-containing protein [Kofleriaceae bacterium]